MAKKKTLDVQKFGGQDDLGTVKMDGFDHDVSSHEAMSQTKLEDDAYEGSPAVIRCFVFGINPIAFKEHPPTHQELFNSHIKGIEFALWRDGLQVFPDVKPRVVIDEKALQYKIFVGSKPARGHLLRENPLSLAQIARGESLGTE